MDQDISTTTMEPTSREQMPMPHMNTKVKRKGRLLRNFRVMIQRAMISPMPLVAMPSERMSIISIIHPSSLPKPEETDSAAVQYSVMPSAMTASMLGHTMETVHSRKIRPTKMPRICIPRWLRGAMGGR